jgi:hypothetical protein
MTTNSSFVGRSSVRAGISPSEYAERPQVRKYSSSLASRTSRTVCSFPAPRMSASSRTEIASDPLRGSVDIARSLLDYTTAVHMSDWKQDKKHRRGARSPQNHSIVPALHPPALGERTRHDMYRELRLGAVDRLTQGIRPLNDTAFAERTSRPWGDRPPHRLH